MKIAVIGSGFGGISAAAYLAKLGHDVVVHEKNSWPGGRARVLKRDGFRFDMGPSWYWLPEEHDKWFSDLGANRADYYQIQRLDPSYKVYFGDSVPDESQNEIVMPNDLDAAKKVFERFEPGGGAKLERFLNQAREKYDFAFDGFIYRNFYRASDMLRKTVVRNLFKLNLLTSYRGLVRRYFRHPYLQRILEFPVVFLGSYARKTPAVYTLMNHVDFSIGTYYPEGGFGRVAQSMKRVAEDLGVRFEFSSEVTELRVADGKATALVVRGADGEGEEGADVFVANADYPYVETALVPREYSSIPPRSWARRTYAPAAMNFYIAFSRKLDFLKHHTFYFDTDWNEHFNAVYGKARWPEDPLFYLHVPSITDESCAPEGHEAVFALVPIAIGLTETDETRQRYFNIVIERMEKLSGESIRDDVLFWESMSIRDFRELYHAYEGSAFGLGQTLRQTAYFRPKNRSAKLPNLYYAGQYTVPGTGTTMSIISGKLAAERISSELCSQEPR